MVIVKVTDVKPFALVLRMSLIINNDYQDCVQNSNFLLESSCCPCGASTRALQKFFRFIAPISFIYWTNCSNIFFYWTIASISFYWTIASISIVLDQLFQYLFSFGPLFQYLFIGPLFQCLLFWTNWSNNDSAKIIAAPL